MERLSSDNWVWNYTVIYINRDARGGEGGWLITYYFLAGVPIIPFSDMFCCEQLSPSESKQICDLRLYLEVRLYLGDMGLIFTDPVSCMCFFSQGSHQLCIWVWLSLCILTCKMCLPGEMLGLPRKNNNNTNNIDSGLRSIPKACLGGAVVYASLPLVCFITVWGGRRTKLLGGHENNVHIMLSFFS